MYLHVLDSEGLATIKRPCEPELMKALVGHMMLDNKEGFPVFKKICIGETWYKVLVEKTEPPVWTGNHER